MKIWKMVGCLVLLAVIICGCVILGQNAAVSAKAETPKDDAAGTAETAATAVTESPPATVSESTATVEKTYSTGLAFRSNGDGTCAVSGLGTCTSAAILIPPTSPAGDTVTEILPNAFSGGIVGAIELPATVSALSAASFASCDRLAYIRVASNNPYFTEYDGALYTADGRTLLYCPAGRTAGDLRLHTAIRRIAAGAFADCRRITTVYFAGTSSEWHALIVGDDNEPLYEATLRFVSA